MVCVARWNYTAAKSRRSTRIDPRVDATPGSPQDRERLDRLGPHVGVILRLILIEDRTLGSVVPGQEELEPPIAP